MPWIVCRFGREAGSWLMWAFLLFGHFHWSWALLEGDAIMPGTLRDPTGIAVGVDGSVLIADTGNHRIVRCKNTNCKTVAGGVVGEDASSLRSPYSVAVSSEGILYIADTMNHRIVRWTLGENKGETIAGGRTSGDLSFPASVSLDEISKHLYVADTGFHRIQRFNLESLGEEAETVVGLKNEIGDTTDTSRLNNPTAVFFDLPTESLFVADARNNRIIRWSEPESNFSVEVVGIKGLAYGLSKWQDNLYYSDHQECVVWKRVDNVTTIAVAGGFGCGQDTTQLHYPAGIALDDDGAVYVADTSNNRAMRFGAEPARQNVVRKMATDCRIALTETNPAPLNLIALVEQAGASSCGGSCQLANFAGGTWGNAASAASTARPEPPFLRTGTFNFGTPLLGDFTKTYALCWGGHVENTVAVENGDCSQLSYTVGTVRFEPYVDADWEATREGSQCVVGAQCNLKFSGYALPNGTYVLAAPNSGPGGSAECQYLNGVTFVGYREFLQNNPGISPPVFWLQKDEGNLTTTMLINMGTAFGMGERKLCGCFKGTLCNAPTMFREPVGKLRIRSALEDQFFNCYLLEGCVLRIRGKFLLETDKLALTAVSDDCDKLRLESVATFPLERPIADVSYIQRDTTGTYEDFFADFNLGVTRSHGRFKVCYCPSHKEPADIDDVPCNSGLEFLQTAGSLEILRVGNPVGTEECVIGYICSIHIEGIMLIKAYTIIVDAGAPSICGQVAPWATANDTNVFSPSGGDDGGDTTRLGFSLGIWPIAGNYQACLCADDVCDDAINYYQHALSIIMRGPTPQVLNCVKGQGCNIAVEGFRLSGRDVLQVCPFKDSDPCGGELCPQLGTNASFGLLSPFSVVPSIANYSLGVLPVGKYSLCYCAGGAEDSPSKISCSVSETVMAAGAVEVRGVYDDQIHSCVFAKSCILSIKGYLLSQANQVMLLSLDGECGKDKPLPFGIFKPSATLLAMEDNPEPDSQIFQILNSTVVGRFRVCYCSFDTCSNYTDYTIDAGPLFVKGLKDKVMETICALGKECSFKVDGFGLNKLTDSALITPKSMGCGGSYVRVNQGSQEIPETVFNGTYRRLDTLWEGRVQFQGINVQHKLYYNVFSSRWILAPKLYPLLPEAPGHAWVGGLWAATPDRYTDLPWNVWVNNSEGSWAEWPDLVIMGAKADNGVFGLNPTRTTSDAVLDDVLGDPYLLSQRYHLGMASALGAYRICVCPSTDFADKDTDVCSGEDEYAAQNGILTVVAVKGDEKYHCAFLGACFVRTVLPESFADRELRAFLVKGGVRCALASQNYIAGWVSSKNATGRLDGELAVFNFGDAIETGQFEVCLCTGSSDGIDSVPCNRFDDFFQHAGSLTVFAFFRQNFALGENISFDLVSGSGFAFTDRLQLVKADGCADADSETYVSSPHALGTNGSSAAYEFGDSVERGTFAVCLCSSFDGVDDGSELCNHGSEFSALVGRVTVSVLEQPSLATISTTEVVAEFSYSRSETRRLSATVSTIIGFNTSDFMTLVESAMLEALSKVTGLSMDVAVFSIFDFKKTSLDARDAGNVSVVKIQFKGRLVVTGSVDEHLSDSCPYPGVKVYLQDLSLVTNPKPHDYQLRQCLFIATGFANERLGEHFADSFLSSVQAIPDLIFESFVSKFEAQQASLIEVKLMPPELSCVQWTKCHLWINSFVPLDGGSVLILDGEDARCGSLSVDEMNVLALSRASKDFPNVATPLQIIRSGFPQNVLKFDVGEVPFAGHYTMCYCINPDASACQYDKYFDQKIGVLRVRGLTNPGATECTVFEQCSTELRGFGLSVLDQTEVLPVDADCGQSGSTRAENFGYNPAPLPETILFEPIWGARSFEFGVPLKIGKYQLCYCASYDYKALPRDTSTTPVCTNTQDYTTRAGILWIRGIDFLNFSFDGVRADDPVAPERLVLHGRGLKPAADKVMLLEWEGTKCGVAGTPSENVAPNPSAVSSVTELLTWGDGTGTDEIEFTVEQAKQIGHYRICFCTYSPAKPCFSSQDYSHEIGSLAVRGALDGHLFVCREGLACNFEIKGMALNLADHILVLDFNTPCGSGSFNNGLVEGNPSKAANVSEDATTASFRIGKVSIFGNPVTFRVCYCANQNADGVGQPCTNTSDYSHIAGVINTVVCPVAPEDDFVFPVEDVFGLGEKSHLRLWTIQRQACTGQNTRSDTELERFDASFPLLGEVQTNQSIFVSTASKRCNDSVLVETARMNALRVAWLHLQLVGQSNDRVSIPFPTRDGVRLQATPSVEDIQLHKLTCPVWTVRFVSLSCHWTGASLYGVLLHLTLISSGLVLFLNVHAEALGSFVKELSGRLRKFPKVEFGLAFNKMTSAQKSRSRVLRRLWGLVCWLSTCPCVSFFLPPMAQNAESWKRMAGVFCPTKKDGITQQSSAAPPNNAKRGDFVLPCLLNATWPILLAILRMGVFMAHCFWVFRSRFEDMDFVSLFMVPGTCVAAACVIQIAAVFAFGGLDALATAAKSYLDIFYSIIATAKVHFDLVLPWLLRKHHCELWRVALVFFCIVSAIQVVIPLCLLFKYMLPGRRYLPRFTRRICAWSLQVHDARCALPAAPQMASTAARPATTPTKNAVSIQDASRCTEMKLRKQFADQGVSGMTSRAELGDPKRSWCAKRCRKTQVRFVEALWAACFLVAPWKATPPEHLQRRRLTGLYAFMDAAGWHVCTSMTKQVIQSSTGVKMERFEARYATLIIIFGGLDLAAMNAYLLAFYFLRLSLAESLVLFTACVVGILQASRPGIGRAMYELTARWVSNPRDGMVWFVLFFTLRLVVAAPLTMGCPDVTIAFFAWSVSVLVVEVPLYFLFYPFLYPKLFGGKRSIFGGERCKCGRKFASFFSNGIACFLAGRRICRTTTTMVAQSQPSAAASAKDGQNLGLPPTNVLKYPGSEPLVTSTFRLIETISDDLRTEMLGSPLAALRQIQRAVENLYRTCPDRNGVTNRLQRLYMAGKLLRAMAEDVRQQARPCRMAFDELRELLDKELHTAKMAFRVLQLVNSCNYNMATLAVRSDLSAIALPQAPKIWLVHWRTLDTLKRFPDMGEKEFLVPAVSAYAQHRKRAVLVPVIHQWRSETNQDPHNVTCRQLVVFAHWYRARWGNDLEIYYWIDCCCAPELAGEMQEEGGSASDICAAGPVGVLNPTARKGLRSLKCWIEEHRTESAEIEAEKAKKTPRISEDDSEAEQPVTQAAADILMPLVFAASDAVVLCESQGVFKSSWVRLGLALAHSFAPSCKIVYAVDRRLVHVPKRIRYPLESDQPPLISTANSWNKEQALKPYTSWVQGPKVMNKNGNQNFDLTDLISMPNGSEMSGTKGRGFHIVAGSTGASYFNDHEGMGYQMALVAKTRFEQVILDDPMDWANVTVHRAEVHRFRIAKLTAMCADTPTVRTVGGFRRPTLRYGESSVGLCRLEPTGGAPRAKQVHPVTVGQPAPPKQHCNTGLEESSSESSNSDEEVECKLFRGRGDALETESKFRFEQEAPDFMNKSRTRYHTGYSDKSEGEDKDSFQKGLPAVRRVAGLGIEGSRNGDFGVRTESACEMLLRRAADPDGATVAMATGRFVPPPGRAALAPLPPPKGKYDPELFFHTAFLPRTIIIGGLGSTAEQVRQAAGGGTRKDGNKASMPSGGMAIISKPLIPREGVSPDLPSARGVFFSVTVEIADSCWGDGLAIGFTAQDPDKWPQKTGKTRPRFASSLPRSYLCGYTGKWMMNGRADIIRKVPGTPQSWSPKTLRGGDVVTAVLAASPVDVFRVLVNGCVVAERSASQAGLPDPMSEQVWGVLDIDGCCIKVRLGTRIPEREPVDIVDLASNNFVSYGGK